MFMERREQKVLTLTKCSPDARSGIGRDNKRKTQKVFPNHWVRIGLKAQELDAVFTNLHKHINVETLKEAFNAIQGGKALGVDKVSKSRYLDNLDENLKDLSFRIQRGTIK